MHIERIRTLVADQKETAIPWLITITQYPREQLESTLTNELGLIIEGELVLTEEEFMKRKND